MNELKTDTELVMDDKERMARMIISVFNAPHKSVVAINCVDIGDDNDYSCFLSGVVYKLYCAGHKEDAMRLANTDPLLVQKFNDESFAAEMERHENFIQREELQQKYFWRNFKGD